MIDLLGAAAMAAVLLGALVQAATGMGFSLIAAPVLVWQLGPAAGIPVTCLLSALVTTVPLAVNRRRVQPRVVAALLVPTLALTPVFAWLIAPLPADTLALAAAACILVSIALLARGLRSRWLRTRPGAVATGASSALLNVVGGVGGPPIGLYAANAGWPPGRLQANLHAFFLIQNVVTVLVLGVHLPAPPVVAVLVLGTCAGTAAAGRLSPRALQRAVLLLAGVGALGLVAGTV